MHETCQHFFKNWFVSRTWWPRALPTEWSAECIRRRRNGRQSSGPRHSRMATLCLSGTCPVTCVRNMYFLSTLMAADWLCAVCRWILYRYAHYDNVAAFSDFKAFAGWTTPYAKQYAGDVTLCRYALSLEHWWSTDSLDNVFVCFIGSMGIDKNYSPAF